jgi:hypothetical protein
MQKIAADPVAMVSLLTWLTDTGIQEDLLIDAAPGTAKRQLAVNGDGGYAADSELFSPLGSLFYR